MVRVTIYQNYVIGMRGFENVHKKSQVKKLKLLAKMKYNKISNCFDGGLSVFNFAEI